MTNGPDMRLTPWRGGVAAAHLKGVVEASHFVEGRVFQVVAPVTSMRRSPDVASKQETQALMGEEIRIYGEEGAWGWGQSAFDDYVGWVRMADLSGRVETPTHHVSVLRTIVFSQADLKSAPVCLLSQNARVRVVGRVDHYAQISTGGWVHAPHLAALDVFAPDYVAVAQRFTGAPYMWGGRDSLGLDCSGLVQTAMTAAGYRTPRDADMQEQGVGKLLDFEPISSGDYTGLQRGDLVFWPGHVGIMVDKTRILHANAHHMSCETEPLVEAIKRIEATGKLVRAVRRP